MRVVASPAFLNRELNSYNSSLYSHIERLGQPIEEFNWRLLLRNEVPDIFHIHWPEYDLFGPRRFKRVRLMLFRLFLHRIRRAGGTVIWTAHNSFAHDRVRNHTNLKTWSDFLSSVGAVIYLSKSSKLEFEAENPLLAHKESVVIQHGDYIEWLRSAAGCEHVTTMSRSELRIPGTATVMVNFGLIRAYKGVETLVAAFNGMDSEDVHLVVAGEVVDDQLRQSIQDSVAGNPQVHCVLRRLLPAELVHLLNLADLVVLPYRKITNSGSAILALSAGRRVMAPNLGSLPEVQALVGADALRLYDGTISTHLLCDALAWLDEPARSADMTAFAWSSIASQTLDFYKRLASRPTVTARST